MLRVRNPNLSPPPQVRDVYIPHYSPRLIRLLHLIHIHLPPPQPLPHHRITMVMLVRLEDLVTIHAGLGSRATSIISSAISVPGATVDSVQPIIDEVVRIYGNPVVSLPVAASCAARNSSVAQLTTTAAPPRKRTSPRQSRASAALGSAIERPPPPSVASSSTPRNLVALTPPSDSASSVALGSAFVLPHDSASSSALGSAFDAPPRILSLHPHVPLSSPPR